MTRPPLPFSSSPFALAPGLLRTSRGAARGGEGVLGHPGREETRPPCSPQPFLLPPPNLPNLNVTPGLRFGRVCMRRPSGERPLQPHSPGCSAVGRERCEKLPRIRLLPCLEAFSPLLFFSWVLVAFQGWRRAGVLSGLLEVHAEGCFLRRRKKRCSGIFLGKWQRGCLPGPLQPGRARQALRPRFAAAAGAPGRGLGPSSRGGDVPLPGAALVGAASPALRPRPRSVVPSTLFKLPQVPPAAPYFITVSFHFEL